MRVFPNRRLSGSRGLGRVLAFATPAIALSVLGCGATPWQPPPPYGQTYAYDYQGFKSSDTVVVAGSGGGGGYAGVFAFRDRKGVHEEVGGKDPFAQSAPIDGYRFNTHLEGQGARLLPGSGNGPAPAISVSASASVTIGGKTVSAPSKPITTTPQGLLGVPR